jgi:radical SAM superfamily enzyme YgiQ (UPF0313 family)
VVLGGHHASPEAEVVLAHHASVDAVVVGEGERALLALTNAPTELQKTPNLVYRGRLGISRAPSASLLDQSELDSIGPTFSGASLRSTPGKFAHATYVSARGCPLRCSFCAVANEKIRAKSPAVVAKELEELVSESGYSRIAIEDNFFAHSMKRTAEVCSAIRTLRKSVAFTWDCQTRVESLARPGIIRMMAEAGCEAVYVGVEALHPELLTKLGKTATPEAYLQALLDKVVPALLASPIDCHINLQFGVPGTADIHRQFAERALRDLSRKATIAGKTITIFPQLAVMYPGTADSRVALGERRFGTESREVFEAFTEWEARRQPILNWMGRNFAHGTGGIPEGILDGYSLRLGQFEVVGEAVLRILSELSFVESLPGLRLFKYGEFLASPRDSEGTGSQRC